ncbi:MAG: hypothetical protein IT349_19435 [Candidatus Eisenbacteria bacterium]|nr:hypothetical protein [Candidatus Eisenbacteria bacterium]
MNEMNAKDARVFQQYNSPYAGQMPGAPAVEARPSIQGAIGAIEAELNVLDESIKGLFGRVAPILNGGTPPPPEKDANVTGGSDILRSLTSILGRLRRAGASLNAITEMVEL